MSKIRKISSKILRVFRITLMVLGVVFVFQLILAMTSLPFWAQYQLARKLAYVPEHPETIVVMGANGFPSSELLMRLWYTSKLANKYPETKVVLTTPGNFSDSTSTVFQMYAYLIDEGISADRILIDSVGLNTRHQALMVFEMFNAGELLEPMIVVSSPTHVYRAVRSFQKVGFTQVSGVPSTDIELETKLQLNGHQIGAADYLPDVGNSISLRYKFWEYLQSEIIVTREYVAISYYWLQGWI
ncbi:MAG: YdcF family protein [Prolixibacteraceae bacterium]